MRVALVSHSNAHPRQQLFAEELSKHAKVLVVAPRRWGALSVMSRTYRNAFHDFSLAAHDTGRSGDIYNFFWSSEALDAIRRFRPDVVLCAAEWSSVAADQVIQASRACRAKFVLFTWENIHEPGVIAQRLITSCDGIIAGNRDAERMMRLYNCSVARIPQVGVDTNLFSPGRDAKKAFGAISVGRRVEEKGVDAIRKACPECEFVSEASYWNLPIIYSSALLHVTFPHETPQWKEQSMGYVTAEAMACGLPVITSDCGAIPEYLGLSDANIILQKDAEALKGMIEKLLADKERRDREGAANREFIEKNYSNQAVAAATIRFLEEKVL